MTDFVSGNTTTTTESGACGQNTGGTAENGQDTLEREYRRTRRRSILGRQLGRLAAGVAVLATAGISLHGFSSALGERAADILPTEVVQRFTESTADAYNSVVTGIGRLAEQATAGFDNEIHPFEIVEAGQRGVDAGLSYGHVSQFIFFNGQQEWERSWMNLGGETLHVDLDLVNVSTVLGEHVEQGFDADEQVYFVRVDEPTLLHTGMLNLDDDTRARIGSRFVTFLTGNSTPVGPTVSSFRESIETFSRETILNIDHDRAVMCAGALSISGSWAASSEVQGAFGLNITEEDLSNAANQDISVKVDDGELSEFEKDHLIFQIGDRREPGTYNNVTPAECVEFLQEYTTTELVPFDDATIREIQTQVDGDHSALTQQGSIVMDRSYGLRQRSVNRGGDEDTSEIDATTSDTIMRERAQR